MTLSDLAIVLRWAAEEGWNPGLDDAEAFLQADPNGFLIKLLDGVPIAAISVVNHSEDSAFLGLYLCHPRYRGLGHGMKIWNQGIAHAGSRTITLEGVPAQQSNYEASGFEVAGRTIRFQGEFAKTVSRLGADKVLPRKHQMIETYQTTFGFECKPYMSNWLTDTPHRKTIFIHDNEGRTGFATARACGTGTKLGPFFAENESLAMELMNKIAPHFDAPFFIDLPDSSLKGQSLFSSIGFAPVFETARMIRGKIKYPSPGRYGIYAPATLELG